MFALTVIVRLPADAELPALIQGSLTVTVQLVPQLAPPDTATDSLPPEAGKLNDVGVTLGGEPEPACVMTTLVPPIVTVPDRPQPVFAVTVTVRLPADAELAAPIQESLTVTVQLDELQPAPGDTVTDRLPPEAGKLNDVGVTLGGELEPAACVMTTLLPPIVTVPDRPQPVFALTVIAKLPADAEPPALIQGSLTVTVQLVPQLAPPDTATDWLPPEAGKLNDVGVTLGGEPEPACVMTTLLPPIVTVPDRPQPVFALAVIARLPADAELAALIQESLTVTVQFDELQPAPGDTVTDRLPPEAGKLNDVGVTLGGTLGPAACVMTTLLPPIVTVPDRPQPMFALTVIAKLPADAVEATLIQVSLAVTAQLQPAGPATVTFRLPAADVNVNGVGVTPVADAGHGSTTMGMSRPPMVTVPDRPALPEPTVTVTRPASDTLDGVVPIQAWLSLTGQLQPAGPVTDRLSVPPAAGNLNDDGLTLVGDVGHGSTVTGTSVPPIATVPDRSGGPGVTLTCTVPPAGTVEGVAVIQAWLSLTDQRQWAGPVTVRRCVPPGHAKVNDDGVTLSGVLGQANRGTLTGMSRLPTVTVPDSPAWPESTVTVTLPPVDTLVGVVVIQAWSSLTDQLQPAGPVTDRRCVPPAAENVNDVGETVVGDVGQPEACDTGTELPPMATAPSRAPPGFSAAWIRTKPPPATLDGVVSHTRSALTDQLQSLRPVTLTYRTLVTAGKLVDVGDTRSGEDGQGPGGCCVTVNVAPATVRVAVRLDDPPYPPATV